MATLSNVAAFMYRINTDGTGFVNFSSVQLPANIEPAGVEHSFFYAEVIQNAVLAAAYSDESTLPPTCNQDEGDAFSVADTPMITRDTVRANSMKLPSDPPWWNICQFNGRQPYKWLFI